MSSAPHSVNSGSQPSGGEAGRSAGPGVDAQGEHRARSIHDAAAAFRSPPATPSTASSDNEIPDRQRGTLSSDRGAEGGISASAEDSPSLSPAPALLVRTAATSAASAAGAAAPSVLEGQALARTAVMPSPTLSMGEEADDEGEGDVLRAIEDLQRVRITEEAPRGRALQRSRGVDAGEVDVAAATAGTATAVPALAPSPTTERAHPPACASPLAAPAPVVTSRIASAPASVAEADEPPLPAPAAVSHALSVGNAALPVAPAAPVSRGVSVQSLKSLTSAAAATVHAMLTAQEAAPSPPPQPQLRTPSPVALSPLPAPPTPAEAVTSNVDDAVDAQAAAALANLTLGPQPAAAAAAPAADAAPSTPPHAAGSSASLHSSHAWVHRYHRSPRLRPHFSPYRSVRHPTSPRQSSGLRSSSGSGHVEQAAARGRRAASLGLDSSAPVLPLPDLLLPPSQQPLPATSASAGGELTFWQQALAAWEAPVGLSRDQIFDIAAGATEPSKRAPRRCACSLMQPPR